MLEPEEEGNGRDPGRKEFQADIHSSHSVDVYGALIISKALLKPLQSQ